MCKFLELYTLILILFTLYLITIKKMATPLNKMVIEKIKSNRNKDKAVVNGFIYSLRRTSCDVQYWVCELSGKCTARINTNNCTIIRPTDFAQIEQDHTHAPSQERIEMLIAYSNLKTPKKAPEVFCLQH